MKKLYVGISHWTLDNWFNYDGDLTDQELQGYIDRFIDSLSDEIYKYQSSIDIEVYYLGSDSVRDIATEDNRKQVKIPDWVYELIDQHLQQGL